MPAPVVPATSPCGPSLTRSIDEGPAGRRRRSWPAVSAAPPPAAAQWARTSSTVGSSIPTTSRIGTRSGSEEPPDGGQLGIVERGQRPGRLEREVEVDGVRQDARRCGSGGAAGRRSARPEPSRVTYVVHTAGSAWTSSVRATKRTGIVGSASTARSGAVAVPPPLGAVGDDEGDAARPGRSQRALVGGRHRSGPRRRGVGRGEQLRAAAWPRVGQPLDPLPGRRPVGLGADDDVDVGGAVSVAAARITARAAPRATAPSPTMPRPRSLSRSTTTGTAGSRPWAATISSAWSIEPDAALEVRRPRVGRPARAGGRTRRRARCGAPTASGRSTMARSIRSASVGVGAPGAGHVGGEPLGHRVAELGDCRGVGLDRVLPLAAAAAAVLDPVGEHHHRGQQPEQHVAGVADDHGHADRPAGSAPAWRGAGSAGSRAPAARPRAPSAARAPGRRAGAGRPVERRRPVDAVGERLADGRGAVQRAQLEGAVGDREHARRATASCPRTAAPSTSGARRGSPRPGRRGGRRGRPGRRRPRPVASSSTLTLRPGPMW